MKIITLAFSAIAALLLNCCLKATASHHPNEIRTDSIPNSILHFSAKKDFQRILLEWATSAEFDSRYFSVERSSNGLNWATCARLDAAGNSDSLQEYETIDYSPVATEKLYRLKLVTWNGMVKYSNTLKVDFDDQITLDIYPNPASDFINVEWLDESVGTALIEVYNVAGKKVRSLTTENNQTRVILGKLPAGLYFIRVQKNGRFYSEKFLIR